MDVFAFPSGGVFAFGFTLSQKFAVLGIAVNDALFSSAVE
jgi:hypothetical protein